MSISEMNNSERNITENSSGEISGKRESTLVIRTSEGIEFSMMLAGPVIRSLAWIIDFFCILIISSFTGKLLSVLSIISVDLSKALYLLSFFIISIGYGIITEWYWRGRTVGKRLLRLMVIDVQGLRLQFSQILIRNLMRIIDSLPGFYLLGGVSALINRRGQRLGDFAANTVVISTPKISDPDLDQLMSGKYNTLRNYPYAGARLCQCVTPQEAGIALQAILRRDLLEPQARVLLFEEIAAHFYSKVQFPEEALHGLTNEQYIRNIVDILYFPNKRSFLRSSDVRHSRS